MNSVKVINKAEPAMMPGAFPDQQQSGESTVPRRPSSRRTPRTRSSDRVHLPPTTGGPKPGELPPAGHRPRLPSAAGSSAASSRRPRHPSHDSPLRNETSSHNRSTDSKSDNLGHGSRHNRVPRSHSDSSRLDRSQSSRGTTTSTMRGVARSPSPLDQRTKTGVFPPQRSKSDDVLRTTSVPRRNSQLWASLSAFDVSSEFGSNSNIEDTSARGRPSQGAGDLNGSSARGLDLQCARDIEDKSARGRASQGAGDLNVSAARGLDLLCARDIEDTSARGRPSQVAGDLNVSAARGLDLQCARDIEDTSARGRALQGARETEDTSARGRALQDAREIEDTSARGRALPVARGASPLRNVSPTSGEEENHAVEEKIDISSKKKSSAVSASRRLLGVLGSKIRGSRQEDQAATEEADVTKQTDSTLTLKPQEVEETLSNAPGTSSSAPPPRGLEKRSLSFRGTSQKASAAPPRRGLEKSSLSFRGVFGVKDANAGRSLMKSEKKAASSRNLGSFGQSNGSKARASSVTRGLMKSVSQHLGRGNVVSDDNNASCSEFPQDILLNSSKNVSSDGGAPRRGIGKSLSSRIFGPPDQEKKEGKEVDGTENEGHEIHLSQEKETIAPREASKANGRAALMTNKTSTRSCSTGRGRANLLNIARIGGSASFRLSGKPRAASLDAKVDHNQSSISLKKEVEDVTPASSQESDAMAGTGTSTHCRKSRFDARDSASNDQRSKGNLGPKALHASLSVLESPSWLGQQAEFLKPAAGANSICGNVPVAAKAKAVRDEPITTPTRIPKEKISSNGQDDLWHNEPAFPKEAKPRSSKKAPRAEGMAPRHPPTRPRKSSSCEKRKKRVDQRDVTYLFQESSAQFSIDLTEDSDCTEELLYVDAQTQHRPSPAVDKATAPDEDHFGFKLHDSFGDMSGVKEKAAEETSTAKKRHKKKSKDINESSSDLSKNSERSGKSLRKVTTSQYLDAPSAGGEEISATEEETDDQSSAPISPTTDGKSVLQSASCPQPSKGDSNSNRREKDEKRHPVKKHSALQEPKTPVEKPRQAVVQLTADGSFETIQAELLSPISGIGFGPNAGIEESFSPTTVSSGSTMGVSTHTRRTIARMSSFAARNP